MLSALYATEGKGSLTRVCGLLGCILLATRLVAGADSGPATASAAAALPAPGTDEGERPYHTPLAGEAGTARFLGYPVQIPPQDRGHVNSLILGGSLLFPRQGDALGLPVVAWYLRQVWDDSRTRDTVSIFVNELEYDKALGPLELVTQFENSTLPGAQTELAHNRAVKATSAVWGTLLGSLGPGLRVPLSPHQVDNDLRLQLVGCAGYFYDMRTDLTGQTVQLPPDTLLYGARLRLRVDTLRRNLLELPHSGFATGCDLDYLVRDRWSAAQPDASRREYLHLAGHLVAAGPVPGLPERDRLLLGLYGGTTPGGRGDRYNAFRLNGGPFPSEADDLARPHLTGMVYDDVLATDYVIASAGYRREICFFLYLGLVGSWIWAERATAEPDGSVVFRKTTGVSGSASLDCAFFWNSEINLAYVWDSGVIRNGRSGSGMLLTWNKLF